MKMSLEERLYIAVRIKQLYNEVSTFNRSFIATRMLPQLDELEKLIKQAIKHDSPMVMSHKWIDDYYYFKCKICGAYGVDIYEFNNLGKQKISSILSAAKRKPDRPIFMKPPFLTCNEKIMKDILE